MVFSIADVYGLEGSILRNWVEAIFTEELTSWITYVCLTPIHFADLDSTFDWISILQETCL